MKNIKLLILCNIFISSFAYASWQQDVKVCVKVNSDEGNGVNEGRLGFSSSDVFDIGNFEAFFKGSKCVSHIYNFGPKTLYVRLSANNRVNFVIGDSCKALGFKNINPGLGFYHYLESVNNTGNHHEAWSFTLTEVPNQESYYDSAFYINCDRNSY